MRLLILLALILCFVAVLAFGFLVLVREFRARHRVTLSRAAILIHSLD
jgi:hypothetical protein